MDDRSADPETSGSLVPRAGETLFGCYRVIAELGRANGLLRLHADDTRLCRQVVVTLLPGDIVRDDAAIAALRQAVQRAFRITHRGIVRIYDLIVWDGHGAVVSEFVEGRTLADLLVQQPGGCFDPEDVITWLRQVADTLRYLHGELGIVHGQLCPVGMTVNKKGELQLHAPALTPVLDELDRAPAATGRDAEQLGYRSPQQLAGATLRPADDLYALGATVFALLTGTPPFGADSLAETLRAIQETVPPSMGQRRMESGHRDHSPIPAAWEQAVAAALAKVPEHRPPTAGAFMTALQGPEERLTEKICPGAKPTGSGAHRTEFSDDWAQHAHPDTDHAERRVRRDAQPTEQSETPLPFLDENVQFTVFRPPTLQPLKWHPLLAFAHLAERPLGAPENEPDPVEEVQRQARAVLGDAYEEAVDLVQDSRLAVPQEGELTFVPEVEEVTFNPRQATFLWSEPVHRTEFRMRAAAGTVGRTLRGRLTVFLGQLILADIPLVLRVVAEPLPQTAKPVAESTRPYRKIFASYSHRDLNIVEEFERFAGAMGDRYLRDAIHLRAGELWNDQLRDLIREADVFQLFWSSNSMRSPYCREEWEYALGLDRPNFVRPTYWESPMPESATEGLPGENLRRLHFQRIGFDSASAAAGHKAASEPMTPSRAALAPEPILPHPEPCCSGAAPSPSRGPSLIPWPWLVVVVGVLPVLGWLVWKWLGSR